MNFKKKCIIVILGVITLSGVGYSVKKALSDKETRKFYFYSYDKKGLCTEKRTLRKKDCAYDEVKQFIDDLLLGPETNRYKAVFANDTKLEFLVIKGTELHVGLSKDALYVTEETFDLKNSLQLLRENIVKNFTRFNKIYIYIDGVMVFDN